MTSHCLLEIGVEELPAAYIAPALDQLRREVTAGLESRGLTHGLALGLGTPRRLALFLSNLPSRQDDRTETVHGPPESAAYDAKGLPTKATQGFAARHGVDIAALRVEETSRGRYLAADKRIAGRATAEVLTEIFGEVIPRLSFPKAMTWGRAGLRFARPVRWIVALLDKDVIPLTLAGLAAGRTTRGHRFLNERGDFDLDRADLDHYREALRKRRVLVDPLERRDEVRRQVEAAIPPAEGRALVDEGLVDQVTQLVEWPTAMAGVFDEPFLEVPREVLETAMVHHQRYFPVEGPGGGLINRFVFVSNGSPAHAPQIIAGNERVLRARLADAQFFFREDRKKTLTEHASGLAKVTWQEKLGSYEQKTQRLVRLAGSLAERLGLDAAARERLTRAATLCKADLVTGMVGEFPELQGVMGRIYHLADGGDPEVAQAIEEHYAPRAAAGTLPQTPAGALLSLVDKVDSIVGCFRAGLAPTGSQDPYALRRQALGAVRLLRARPEWALPLTDLIAAAAIGYEGPGQPCDGQVVEFLRLRLRNLLVDEGARPEVADAIFATADDEVRSLAAKVEALGQIAGQPDFREIAAAAKRVLNILRQVETKLGVAAFSRPDGATATEPAEQALADALPIVRRDIAAAWQSGDHLAAFRRLAALRPQVDAFFDTVRVMDDDTAKRDFRLALLAEFRALFAGIADISRIAVEG